MERDAWDAVDDQDSLPRPARGEYEWLLRVRAAGYGTTDGACGGAGTAVRRGAGHVSPVSTALWGAPSRARIARRGAPDHAEVGRKDPARGRVGRRRPTSFVCTTDSTHADPIAENRLARRFALAAVPAVDHVWVGDMTYIPMRAGWLNLAVLIDLASRCVVGWALGTTLATVLPLTALRRALAWRQPAAGLIHHTDRGSPYASREYRAVLTAHGVTASMSRTGDCWDNAVAESFFATLEHELLALTPLRSHREAAGAITEFIDAWYNPVRRHSTLSYVSPMEYERQLRHTAKAA